MSWKCKQTAVHWWRIYNLPALTCTSRLTMDPTSLVARHLYTELCTSCLYMAGGKGSRASVPFDMSCRSDDTSGTGVPSAVSQRMCGAGCPAAVQSIHAPVVLENSNFPGGSSKKDGPVKSDDDVIDVGAYVGNTENKYNRLIYFFKRQNLCVSIMIQTHNCVAFSHIVESLTRKLSIVR